MDAKKSPVMLQLVLDPMLKPLLKLFADPVRALCHLTVSGDPHTHTHSHTPTTIAAAARIACVWLRSLGPGHVQGM